jgi:diguanylate cyclase (GGDEF)-like protein
MSESKAPAAKAALPPGPPQQQAEGAGSSQADRLVEANERLVIAALRAQTDAETAARALKEAARLAERDALTELPNRVLLLDRFAHAIANAKRHGGRLALLFLDIDNFKQINDSLGHAVGDQVLKLAAHCLVSSIRGVDTVSRHGGDEFLILLTEVSQASDAVLVADKVVAALAAPSLVGEHVLRLAASIGISIYPDDGEDADTLIDRADAAMYRAKRQGLGRFVLYGEEPASERGLKSALESPRQLLARYELALAEHERRHAQLREANERLVLAALGAQEQQAAAEMALRRRTELLAEKKKGPGPCGPGPPDTALARRP